MKLKKGKSEMGRRTRFSALVFGLAFALPALNSPFAMAEEEAEQIEEVVVTGTRIGRQEFQGISPVTVIDSADIEASGQLVVADVLRATIQNTLGSTYEGFQNGAVDSNINLRGAGSGRTLVLVDGKRMPGSPKQSGAVTNINVIPTAAIDRVEILTDGASAIYGGDAASGVVNIILKKDFEGVTIRGGTTEPDMGGGKENNFSIVAGAAGDNSNVVFSYEHQERGIIYWKDRWYTKSTGTDSDDYADWTGVSAGSRTFVNGSTFQYLPMAACTGNELMVDNGRIVYDSSYSGDAICGYDYTQIGADDAARKSDAISTQFTYNFSDDLRFSLRGTFSRVEGTSRFAPAVGSYSVPAGAFDIIAPTFVFDDGSEWGPDVDGNYDYSTQPGGAVVAVTNTDNVVPNPVPGFGLVRFTDNGNREMDTTTDLFDITAGLEGTIGNWDWELTAQFANQYSAEFGYNYINKYAYTKLSREDGFDPTDPDTVALYKSDTYERAENRYRNVFGGIGSDLTENLSIFVGFEFFEFMYDSRYDAGRQGFNVIGSAGNSSGGSRDATAFFGEAGYVWNDVTLSASVRYDDYSDFGDSTTYKIGGSYDLLDNLLLRASFGTSFIPPDMYTLYGAPGESYAFATDYVACDAAGTAEADCKARQYATYNISNPFLEAEESESWNVGIVWDITGNQRVSADFYGLKFDNLITRITLQAMINAERAGNLDELLAGTPGNLLRTADGKLSSVIEQASLVPLINSGDLEFSIEGMDVKYQADFDIGPGVLGVDLDYTMYFEYASTDGGDKFDSVGEYGIPEWRANLYLDYTIGNHSARAVYHYIPSTAEDRDSSNKLIGKVSDYGILDLSYAWQAPANLKLTFGVRNVLDEGAVLTKTLEYDRGLYDLGHLGMVSYLNASLSF